jgi:nicotinate dehydrogenase subunit B
VMGDTMLTPYDFGTVGSMTTPIMAPQLHKVAAAAREMLADLAAAEWKADRGAVVVEDGRVRNTASGKTLSFEELTKGQKLSRTIAADVRVTPANEWKIAGRDLHKVNARSIVSGKEKYTSDMKLPGMLHGRVVRPAGFKAELVTADLKPAESMAGVVAVRDGEFIGVASEDAAKLDAAASAVKAQWKVPAQTNSKDVYQWLKSHPAEAVSWQPIEADVKLEASYNVAYIAHTPLEP